MIPICHPSLKPIDRILSGWWIIGKIIFIRVFDHPSSFVLLNVSLRFPTAYETQASESNVLNVNYFGLFRAFGEAHN